MDVYLRAKFEVSGLSLTTFRWGNFTSPPPQNEPLKSPPKSGLKGGGTEQKWRDTKTLKNGGGGGGCGAGSRSGCCKKWGGGRLEPPYELWPLKHCGMGLINWSGLLISILGKQLVSFDCSNNSGTVQAFQWIFWTLAINCPIQRGFFKHSAGDLLLALRFLGGLYNFCNFVIIFPLL